MTQWQNHYKKYYEIREKHGQSRDSEQRPCYSHGEGTYQGEYRHWNGMPIWEFPECCLVILNQGQKLGRRGYIHDTHPF
jgi:hypothetical protein